MKNFISFFLSLGILFTGLLMISGCSSSSNLTSGDNSQVLFRNSNIGSLNNNNSSKLDTVKVYSNQNIDLIRAGDQLQISVWGYPEFNTTTTVKDYGTVTIPLIGEVMAAGLTTDGFTTEVSQRLSEYVKGDPKVTVSHIDMNKRISVMGAVNKQDNYTSLSDISLVEIISAAGGPAPDADLAHVKIFRKGKISDGNNSSASRRSQSSQARYHGERPLRADRRPRAYWLANPG